jgi:hypothetical protein
LDAIMTRRFTLPTVFRRALLPTMLGRLNAPVVIVVLAVLAALAVLLKQYR